MNLYTIGHSRHPIDKFIYLLTDHHIKVLVDVRSTPYSRFNPQFNKNALHQTLEKQAIEYLYAGNELGGRPKDPSCYRHQTIPEKSAEYLHEIDYPEVMKRSWFLQGIQRLREIASLHTTAIMCSEEDPAHCHRHHLLTKYLMDTYPEVTILHIRGDGSLINTSSIPGSSDQTEAEQLSF